MEGFLLGTVGLLGFQGLWLICKGNVLCFPHSVLRQECGLREHSGYLAAGLLYPVLLSLHHGKGETWRGGGVPRSKRLGSTIHLQINNLYVVLLSYNRINRCSVEEKKSGIR